MRYVTQRYKVRAEDGEKFVLTRWEWGTLEQAQACADGHAARETSGALYEVVDEDDEALPTYVAPIEASPDPLAEHIQRCRNFVVPDPDPAVLNAAEQLDIYLANPAPTAAESVAALKETIRTLRSLIRVARRVALDDT